MKKILLFGKNGQVGFELQSSLAKIGFVIGLSKDEANFECQNNLRQIIRKHQPDVIVNAAAYTAVDLAESERKKAKDINIAAVGVLAEESIKINAILVHYSTDYVFDGEKNSPYLESDLALPKNIYGLTKLASENEIKDITNRHLIFRTSWIYSLRGKSFIQTILKLASEQNKLTVVQDQIGAPTSAKLIADITTKCLYKIFCALEKSNDYYGLYHLTASGYTSWYDYAVFILQQALKCGAVLKLQPNNILPINSVDWPTAAKRPLNSRLNTDKLVATFGVDLPDWQVDVRETIESLKNKA